MKVAVGFNPRLAAESVRSVAERRLNAGIFSNAFMRRYATPTRVGNCHPRIPSQPRSARPQFQILAIRACFVREPSAAQLCTVYGPDARRKRRGASP
jgi:hypothetical protein